MCRCCWTFPEHISTHRSAFDRKVLDVMNLMGVSPGKFTICVGYRKVMDTLVRLVRWDDDFSLSGRRSLCIAFRDELGKHLLVKTTAVMGPSVEMGNVQEAIHLNTLLRLDPPGAEGGERWELEADPRHVEILVSQMVGKESQAVSTPGCAGRLMRKMARSLVQWIELATDRGRCGPAVSVSCSSQ